MRFLCSVRQGDGAGVGTVVDTTNRATDISSTPSLARTSLSQTYQRVPHNLWYCTSPVQTRRDESR